MQLVTAETVAHILNVGKPKVYELARSIFPARVVVRLGRRMRFNQAALEQWIAEGGYGIQGGSRVTEIDRLLHEPSRLAIVDALTLNESLTFNALKTLTGSTDGNLGVHARKLEHAGYLAAYKRFNGRTPQTTFRLTTAGREALGNYLDHMNTVIRLMRKRISTSRRENET